MKQTEIIRVGRGMQSTQARPFIGSAEWVTKQCAVISGVACAVDSFACQVAGAVRIRIWKMHIRTFRRRWAHGSSNSDLSLTGNCEAERSNIWSYAVSRSSIGNCDHDINLLDGRRLVLLVSSRNEILVKCGNGNDQNQLSASMLSTTYYEISCTNCHTSHHLPLSPLPWRYPHQQWFDGGCRGSSNATEIGQVGQGSGGTPTRWESDLDIGAVQKKGTHQKSVRKVW